MPLAVGMAVGEVGRDLDPLPALGLDLGRHLAQPLGDHQVDQADILELAAVVALEQVAHDAAARLDIGIDVDEPGAFVRRAHRALGQHPPDGVRLAIVGGGEPFDHLLLALVVR